MEDKVRFRVLKWGTKPPGISAGLPLPPRPPRNVAFLFAPSGSHVDHGHHHGPSRDRSDSVFYVGWPFFANLFEHALREELTTLACSARRDFSALSLAGLDCWETLWTDRECEENSRLEKSVNNLTSQQDTYSRDLYKVYASLQEVRKVLAPFNLSDIMGSQVIYLEKMLQKRTRVLDSLAQELKECASVNLVVVVESFENALQQVEHLHHSLVVSREQVWLGQIL